MNAPGANRGRLAGLSVRTRFAIWMTGSYIVLFVALGTALFLHQRVSLDRQLDAGLAARTAAIAAEVADDSPALVEYKVRRMVQLEPQTLFFSRMRVALLDLQGQLLASSVFSTPTPSMEDLRAVAATDEQRAIRGNFPGYSGAIADWHLVLQRVSIEDGQVAVLVAGTEGEGVSWLLENMFRIMMASLLIGSIAAMIAAWGVGRLVHASLEDLRRVAESLTPERLEEEVDLRALSPESATLQRDLQEVRARLSDALRAQERFTSNASHELKTPIAVLLTEAQTLNVESLPPQAQRFVHSVTDEMRRLGRMAESFLTLTRLRSGHAETRVHRHPVTDILFDAIESSSAMAKQYGVHLIAELPDTERELIVAGDADLLRVMLDNLIRNAIRFSPADGRVIVAVREATPELEISVRDYGPGVPTSLLETVFNRFSQADDECNRRAGHGLGLAIAQGVAELHGGRIRVENLADGGCAFTVTLTIASTDSVPDEGVPVPAQSPAVPEKSTDGVQCKGSDESEPSAPG